jgi:hypothetical protein
MHGMKLVREEYGLSIISRTWIHSARLPGSLTQCPLCLKQNYSRIGKWTQGLKATCSQKQKTIPGPISRLVFGVGACIARKTPTKITCQIKVVHKFSLPGAAIQPQITCPYLITIEGHGLVCNKKTTLWLIKTCRSHFQKKKRPVDPIFKKERQITMRSLLLHDFSPTCAFSSSSRWQ